MVGLCKEWKFFVPKLNGHRTLASDSFLLDLTVTCTWCTYSLLGSFVPFGGFFASQADISAPLTIARQPFTRCNACNEMYEQELSHLLRQGSSVSIADAYSKILSSSLQRSDSDLTKGRDVVAQVCYVTSPRAELPWSCMLTLSLSFCVEHIHTCPDLREL